MNTSLAIQQNNHKVYIYMMVLTLFIGLLGHFISMFFNFGLTGTGCFLITAGLINFLAYFFSDTLLLRSSHAKILTREMIPDYFDLVEQLTQKAGLKMPRLFLIEEDAINAFATGRNQDKAAVAVTRGLLEKLTPDEISGVVAHELAHVQFNDMRLMAVVSVLAGVISIFADMFWRNNAMSDAQSRDRSGVLAIVGVLLSLLAPITTYLVQLAISRQREYIADARAAEITGNPNFLIQAFEKIKRDQIPMPSVSSASAHLYIANPFKQGSIEILMSTHPDIDDRIARLKSLTQ